jgi:hypothetical protein
MSPLLKNTPTKHPSKWSKPWWNPNLTQLRKIFHSISGEHKCSKNSTPPPSIKKVRNIYITAIAAAKKEYWNSFLTNATPNEVWAVKRMKTSTKADLLPSFPDAASPDQVASSLINHFFPPRNQTQIQYLFPYPN